MRRSPVQCAASVEELNVQGVRRPGGCQRVAGRSNGRQARRAVIPISTKIYVVSVTELMEGEDLVSMGT